MNQVKIILILLFITFFVQASNDHSIYQKNYASERKTALVIGNSHYTRFGLLKNTLNDARDMRKILKAKGFKVLYLEDGDLRSMKKIVRKFSRELDNGGVGFFYYAGHGIEVEQKNYLIPIGAEIPEKDEVEYGALAVDMLIDKMEGAKSRINIIVLDACRNDPFSRGGGGLSRIYPAEGTYISFATAPGKVASDGDTRNGLYTKYLIKYISQPNLTLKEVFEKTQKAVYQESGKKQHPWISSSMIGDFYFQIDATPKEATIANPVEMSEAEKMELDRYRREEIARLRAELSRFKKEQKEREARAQREREAAIIARQQREAEIERVAKKIAEANNKFSLTISTNPRNAKVQITNIKQRYHAGIKLRKGTYKIKISKKGYKSKKFTIKLEHNLYKPVKLTKIRAKKKKKKTSTKTKTKVIGSRGVWHCTAKSVRASGWVERVGLENSKKGAIKQCDIRRVTNTDCKITKCYEVR